MQLTISKSRNTCGVNYSLDDDVDSSFYGLAIQQNQRLCLTLPEKYEPIVRVFDYFSNEIEMAKLAGAEIVSTRPGAYGGICDTVQIDLDSLNTWCQQAIMSRQDIFGPVDQNIPACCNCGSTQFLLSGSLGLLCADCYDNIEGFL